jgi:outer membrane protein OmpA-like peptidoglycan-associated protein
MIGLRWNGKQGIAGHGNAAEMVGLTLAALLAGAWLLVLTVPVAQAQSGANVVAEPRMQSPGQYLVTFGLDQTTLTEENRRIIAQAAEDYRRGGAPQVSVTGHTDTAGSAAYNQQLSERRAEMVAQQLEREGVPATSIITTGRGEQDLLVPTADGVREPRNRRVEIVVPQPPPPPPVVAAPAPPPAPAPAAGPEKAQEEQPKNVFTIGPVYGHNFGETGNSQSDLAGVHVTYNALPGFLGGLSLKQDFLHSFNAQDDGWAGRSVLSLDFAPQLGPFRPFLSANGGGVYGKGAQDGFVAGPEIGFNLNLFRGVTMRASVAYDYQFRNSDLGDGILWTGLGFGFGF